MTVFPQLNTGALAQFPFRRERAFRTLLNQAGDGSEIAFADVDFHERVWELPFAELSDAEWQGVQDLFEQVEGRLQSFLFMEPGANLLSWSEFLSDAAWERDAGISLLEGQADPMGGTAAGRLTSGGASGTLRQRLNVPASFRYAGSVWARTAAASAFLRVDDDGGQLVEREIETDNEWKRYSVRYDLSSPSEWVVFRVVVPAGGVVEIFGPQLEGQPAVSVYKRTLKQAGVYPNARFGQDVLGDRATGVGRHAGVVRILWVPSQT